MPDASPDFVPDPDGALRRQLRFSLFLQGFAAVMMGGAAAVRLFAFGRDALTLVLALAFALILGAAFFTWRKLQAMPRT
ncbi:MAG: hypothetical protein WCP95_04705 [Actinomycetes bacterium]